MAHYGMGEGCKSFPLFKSQNPKMEMDALVPSKPVIYPVETVTDSTFRIKAIRGLLSYHQSKNCNGMSIYPKDSYQIHPGDQYVGIYIELDEIMRSNVWDDESGNIVIEEDSFEELLVIQISDEPDCCEVWGAMLSEDNLSRFIGSDLLEVYFTDTSLNTEYLQTIAKYKYPDDYHNVQFINVKTSKGTFQFTVYNCHNGYYGHDVTVSLGNYGTLYSGVI